MIVYLNANFVIYFIEMNPVWGPKVTAHLTALLANGDQLAISDLTRLECQVGPTMTGNTVLLRCSFPEAGRYTIQVWFFQEQGSDVLKGELPLSVATEGV